MQEHRKWERYIVKHPHPMLPSPVMPEALAAAMAAELAADEETNTSTTTTETASMVEHTTPPHPPGDME